MLKLFRLAPRASLKTFIGVSFAAVRVAVTGSVIITVLITVAACTKKTASTSGAGATMAPAERGKRVYATYCIACHSPDPHKDGAVGPALFGASLDLIEHRVLKTEYPAGYTPKRTTRIMPPFPYLKDEIPALHAYLNSP